MAQSEIEGRQCVEGECVSTVVDGEEGQDVSLGHLLVSG